MTVTTLLVKLPTNRPSFLGPDPDDKLSEGHTDAQGMFQLQGSTHELTNIDPVCKVYHDCDVSFLGFL